ncbi:carboxylesterase family protein [Rhodococcus sp. BP-252]|nr:MULTISPECIES: carboxylesterase family protein [unclassified Rhodococcus (in: high G+C Gram-positive bacteria)]MBY6414663.1 carboxylesterase family protein [Rhodococcus sp. BP-320]MBY6419488.1 carboxylesterase family protein [Rhodococcus sp. BP-321]MBY6429499.1 carboxylesterase family protein [Rhodococcus sp. BP-323]MBY6448154.1 carboxylesterase family protein [Rhodococcus sp. BP-318]MBY6477471.1 carboxylesterase family protein [Rhodococcus sp. BP-261]MBY6502095.1 carboxylesterase family pr
MSNIAAVVDTASGPVRGLRDSGFRIWRGIPYAEPPIRSLRWHAPVAPTPWDEVRAAVDFSARAPQTLVQSLVPPGCAEPNDSGTVFSEDCLYLNICTPDVDTGNGLPVLVWFHGGGFVWGSGPTFIGDGRGIAREKIVVVTVNYRLGALGFLRLDHILGEDYLDSANCGLLDQIAALRWVRSNIAAFGGDPNNVSIGGVSAGGKSVANIMASGRARGMFHRGIIHSGGDHVTTPDAAADLTARLLEAANIPLSSPRKILEVPAHDLVSAQNAIAAGARATWVWRPMVDGRTLQSTPTVALAGGIAANVSVIAGVTRNEAGSYDLADPTAAEQAQDVLRAIFGESAVATWEHYVRAAGGDERHAGRTVLADERYGIPTARLLAAQASYAPVWRFRFDAPTPGASGDRNGFHGADTPYLWDVAMESATPELARTARHMRERWISFITSGDPNQQHLPRWHPYEPKTQSPVMLIDTEPTLERNPDHELHSLWNDAAWIPGTWWPVQRSVQTA